MESEMMMKLSACQRAAGRRKHALLVLPIQLAGTANSEIPAGSGLPLPTSAIQTARGSCISEMGAWAATRIQVSPMSAV